MKCPICKSPMICYSSHKIDKYQEYYTEHYVYRHRFYKCLTCDHRISTKEIYFNDHDRNFGCDDF